MANTERTQRFADALLALEKGDDAEMLAQFSDGAELQRPERKHGQAQENDPSTFWQQYLSEFNNIETTFDRIVEQGDEGILEWHSKGSLAAGRDIEYAGVSVLSFDGDSVARFATYYDTAAFVEPAN